MNQTWYVKTKSSKYYVYVQDIIYYIFINTLFIYLFFNSYSFKLSLNGSPFAHFIHTNSSRISAPNKMILFDCPILQAKRLILFNSLKIN